MSICPSIITFFYLLSVFEVTFFYLIYLSYFLLSSFCMCSNASHHVYVQSCFKYPLMGNPWLHHESLDL
jgi:hypothetical protein